MYAKEQMPAQRYREMHINSASPLQLILMAYDAAIIGCAQHDLKRTTESLKVLRNSLNFEQGQQVAWGLFRLYQYCADLARDEKYDEAAQVLRELVQAWVQVLVRENATRPMRNDTRQAVFAAA
jgi:flagellin-specific chaperone FliS